MQYILPELFTFYPENYKIASSALYESLDAINLYCQDNAKST